MMNDTSVRYFSLLYVDHHVRSHANLSSSIRDPIDIYIECASTLAASLARSNASLMLLTNNASFVLDRIMRLELAVRPEVHEIAFSRDVPHGIPFYSAHFKLDLFRYFSTIANADLICLLDGDTVLLSPLHISRGLDNGLVVYDITPQLSRDYTPEQLANDIELVGGKPSANPCWYGGEFILGSARTFGLLADKVDQLWPRYCEHIREVHHVGDEMVVTAALTLLQADGVELTDAGDRKFISRWWTARTNCTQLPFELVATSNILHLPSDKPFLASKAKYAFDTSQFLAEYIGYARLKLLGRRIVNPFLNLAKRQKKFVATLV